MGSETARLLGQRQRLVRVLVRDPEEATVPAHAGAEVAAGALEVPATIDTAMQGVSVVVLVSPAIPGLDLTVIDSAVRSGARYIVKITSKASADSPIARRRGQAQIEKGLTASGIGCTPLRNNACVQNFHTLASAIARTSGFGCSAVDGRIGMVDTRDVAAVAAGKAQALSLFARGNAEAFL